MGDKVKISQQASNHGYIKGSPKGAGHGGFVIDSQAKPTAIEELRFIYSTGKVPHIKDKDGSNYIVRDFLAGDKIQAAHICPIKLSKAQNDNSADKISDIISSVDELSFGDIKLANVFDSDNDVLNYFLMDNDKVSFESHSKFDSISITTIVYNG